MKIIFKFQMDYLDRIRESVAQMYHLPSFQFSVFQIFMGKRNCLLFTIQRKKHSERLLLEIEINLALESENFNLKHLDGNIGMQYVLSIMVS